VEEWVTQAADGTAAATLVEAIPEAVIRAAVGAIPVAGVAAADLTTVWTANW
jgi:hypothetical protein